jgi:hypothetical protein
MPGLATPTKIMPALVAAVVTILSVLSPVAGAQQPFSTLGGHGPAGPALGIPPGLPPGLPPLYGVDCPAALHCTVVGGSGTRAIALSTSDGVHWVKTALPGPVGPLYQLSCTTPTNCVAVGAGQPGHESAETVDGTHWQQVATPTGTVPLDSVSCVVGGCVAVGDRYDSSARAYRSSLVVRKGDAWQASPLPAPTALLQSTSCTGPRDCWVAGGGGIYFSSNLFSSKSPTWASEPVPQSQGLGWLIDSVQFTGRHDGVASGGAQCGGFFVLQCTGVTFRTIDGGAHWTMGQLPAQGAPFVVSASCAKTGCLALGQSFTNSVVLSSKNGSAWEQSEATAGFLYSSTCTARLCLAVGENSYGTGGILLSSLGGSTASSAMPRLPGARVPVNLSFTGPVTAHFTSASVPDFANATPASGFCGAVPKSTVAGFFDLLAMPGAQAIGVLRIVLEDYHGPGKYVVTATEGGAAPAIELSSFPGSYKLVAPATIVVDQGAGSGTISADYAREVVNPAALGAAHVGTAGPVGRISGTWAC